MPTLGSLFAGIGGFDIGFGRVGFKTSWLCEIDVHAASVLRRHFPEAALHRDVSDFSTETYGPVDVITFGSPCQDLSIAGKHAGLAGEKSGLFFEAIRIIRECREKFGKPDFVVWENVPNALSSNDGADFAAVLNALANIGAVDIGWRVLDSKHFGVPQGRKRLLLVASFGEHAVGEVLDLVPEGARDRKSGKPKKEKAAAGSGGCAMGHHPAGTGPAFRMLGFGHYTESCVASTLKARDYKDATDLVLKHGQLRQYTPVERERLQGFPDGWTEWGIDSDGDKIPQATMQRVKQLGNAVTVNVVQAIAQGLRRFYV